MNRAQLIDAISADTGLTKKEADAALKSFIENTKKALNRGEKLQLVGFGTFEVVEKDARKGRNPATGKEMIIPAKRKPKMTISKNFLN